MRANNIQVMILQAKFQEVILKQNILSQIGLEAYQPRESANVVRIPGEQEDGVLKEENSERNGGRSSIVEQASEGKGKGNASLGEYE
ncbi:hypothetical protein Pint_26964 [Pistacia integerrima]|uniref:Uncharacterized protein n=1 Tax=Pistacia integerrima TaxID=434235 RepID=A0ACC0YUH5_9ROSI|nr:hypothetical protein Pint_26964 [Pistacia integerrima]